MRNRRPAKYRILLIFLTILTGLLLTAGLSLYLILHGYIGKINRIGSDVPVTAAGMITDENGLIASGNEVFGEIDSGIKSGTDESNEFESKNHQEDQDSMEEYEVGDESSHEAIQLLENKIYQNMKENSTPVIGDKDVFNILLIGCDSREEDSEGRSDAMILVSINEKTKTLTATSILRDIYLYIPGKGNNRINSAYAFGGAELLMDTIEQNFRIKIDRYAILNFYAFIDVINEVDGITLDISKEELPIINFYITELNELTGVKSDTDLLYDTGSLKLNGKQALGYVRNRYIGMDFERTARQRRVLELTYEKIKNCNIIKLSRLLDLVLPQITTNLTEGELFSMILKLPAYKNYNLEQWRIPVEDSYSFLKIRGMSVIGIDFERNSKELESRIYGDSD